MHAHPRTGSSSSTAGRTRTAGALPSFCRIIQCSFVCDDLFELIFARSGTGDVSRVGLCRNMVDPVPTQCVIVDLKLTRRSLDRRASRKKPLNPHTSR